MSKNRYLTFVIMALAGAVLISTYLPTRAQGTYQPIMSLRDFAGNARWSSDSTEFVFQHNVVNYGGVETPTNTWYDYHSATQQLTQSNRWPFQPALSQTQKTTLTPATDSLGQHTFVFISPNRRFIVYARQPVGYDEFSLALADLNSTTYANLPSIIVGTLADMHCFNVTWSADSSTFTVETNRAIGGPTHTYYVTNSANSLNALTIQSLDEGISCGNRIWYADNILAVSNDGSLVLLSDYVSSISSVLVWNVAHPCQSQEVSAGGINVPAALFVSGNMMRIRFIGKSGLTDYDLITHQATLLDANIDSTWVIQAWFSPDGSKVALMKPSGSIYDSGVDVYVLPVLHT